MTLGPSSFLSWERAPRLPESELSSSMPQRMGGGSGLLRHSHHEEELEENNAAKVCGQGHAVYRKGARFPWAVAIWKGLVSP
jgi:hypothetical protein